MKVCVIGTRGFPYIEGGVEKHCESLYPLMAENMQIIVFRRKPYVDANSSSATYPNIRFIDLPSTRIKGFEALFHSFLAAVKAISLRPDVVHFHNIGPALLTPLIKLFSIPVVLTYHSPNYEHKKWGAFAKWLLRFSEKVALKFSDRIIFVNSFQMDKYPPHIQEKSVYIPNGIQPPVCCQEQSYLDSLGLEPKKYILSVGRVTPEKGFHTLIKAFNAVKPDGFKLVIAGGVEFENGYMKELQSLSKSGDVVFTGYVFGDQLAQLYQNAALFVLASENEGFPLVLLEAMSYHLDVLVSDIPATRLVRLDASDYVPCGDYAELGRKLQEKLSDVSPRTYELTQYDWSRIAQMTDDILREAIME